MGHHIRGRNKIGADANVGVGRVVVVAVAVVVDIREVRGRHDITQPPVRTFNGYPASLFSGFSLFFPARYLLAAFRTPLIRAISSLISAVILS